MKPTDYWLSCKPLSDRNVPAWIRSIEADKLRHAAGLIKERSDESACDSCNRFLAGVWQKLSDMAGELEK